MTPNKLHIGIIMDGNGRWATGRGLPRVVGHRRGARSVRRIVEAAPDLGIGTLTLYAFSSDNWQRPEREVSTLMSLLRQYLQLETARCIEKGVRLSFIGRRDRIPTGLADAITVAEHVTRCGNVLHLRIAVDYSGRDSIVHAISELKDPVDRQSLSTAISTLYGTDDPVPDVDMIIRTGGEQRLSDFLLWESAYAELYFTDCMWPDFDGSHLKAAISSFNLRERRFGRASEAVAC